MLKNRRSIFGVLYVFAHHIKMKFREGIPVWSYLRHLPDFLYYNLGEKTPLERELPWITVEAIREIRKYLKPEMRVFEYGSGGSTLFFARQVNELVSVEHHPDWYEIVKNKLAERQYHHVQIQLIPPVCPENAKPVRYPSMWKKEYKGLDFYQYAQSIEQYEDGYFDLILIDGRARPYCLEASISKLKKGGLLVFDNADREIYQNAIQRNIGKWLLSKNFGPDVGSLMFSETDIYYKPLI